MPFCLGFSWQSAMGTPTPRQLFCCELVVATPFSGPITASECRKYTKTYHIFTFYWHPGRGYLTPTHEKSDFYIAIINIKKLPFPTATFPAVTVIFKATHQDSKQITGIPNSSARWSCFKKIPSLKLTATAPENRPKPQKERLVSQTSIFSGDLLVLRSALFRRDFLQKIMTCHALARTPSATPVDWWSYWSLQKQQVGGWVAGGFLWNAIKTPWCFLFRVIFFELLILNFWTTCVVCNLRIGFIFESYRKLQMNTNGRIGG